ncbi:MAG: Mitochondrial distribution and morphology protein 10, partial [Piccolia ochrophora]
MLGFMDHVQAVWLEATNWNRDNSYSTLTATSQALLDFPVPHGLRLHVSSLSSPHIGTSYTLGSTGLVDGSLSYLYSSLPLATSFRSSALDLRTVVQGYRQLQELNPPDEPWWWEIWRGGRRVDRRNTLLYGRLYLPSSTLEALYLRRLSPTRQLKLTCVSDSRLKNGGTILAHLTHSTPSSTIEGLFSTDSALLGLRALYNFPHLPSTTTSQSPPSPPSRLSTGFELYYGLQNGTLGLSTGLRFVTLPPAPSTTTKTTTTTPTPSASTFPLTATLTLNPLTGSLSTTYAVRATRLLSLASRFDFNVYSYDSEVVLGCELWRMRRRRRKPSEAREEVEWAARKMRTLDGVTAASDAADDLDEGSSIASSSSDDDDNIQGVIKARINQRGAVGVVWEGRVKEMLVTI